jgi:hypothetical protein
MAPSLPKYEIFGDFVDPGKRIVFVATADGFTRVQPQMIVAEVIKGESGKKRWTRVFVPPESARNQVQRGECLEASEGGTIQPCDYRR